MSLKDTLRKAAGLLVELPPEDPVSDTPSAGTGVQDGADLDKRLADLNKEMDRLSGKPPGAPPAPSAAAPQARTVEQIVRDSPGPNLDQVKVTATESAVIVMADGTMDFQALYQRSNIPAASFTAEQMLEMLSSLPAELPLDTKRQTVKATIGSMGKAIGATPETIVADTSRKLAALAAYTDSIAKQAAEFVSKAQMEIAAMQAKIEDQKKAIDRTQQKLSDVTAKCEAESDRLDDVLEFFSLDVPPSKHAEPEAKSA